MKKSNHIRYFKFFNKEINFKKLIDKKYAPPFIPSKDYENIIENFREYESDDDIRKYQFKKFDNKDKEVIPQNLFKDF